MTSVFEDEQSGLTVNAVIQNVADDWGSNPSSNRFKNSVLRRYNMALRDINLRLPKARMLRVVDAEANLIAGQSDYIVTDSENDGGFGWTDCVEVVRLVFTDTDNRPLETLSLEQFRERSELLSDTGPAGTLVIVDPTRIKIYPAPTAAQSGIGDYLTQFPSLSSMTARVTGIPKFWDKAIQSGVDFYTARAKLRERPAAVDPYERRFMRDLSEIETNEKTAANRPQAAMVTRTMRSRRTIPTDNSTDIRFWR